MSTPGQLLQTDPIRAAYEEGRRFGLATSALALSIVAFVNLLGMEKSILAVVLGWLSLRGAVEIRKVMSRARAALVIAAVHLMASIVVLVAFRDKLSALIQLLSKLG